MNILSLQGVKSAITEVQDSMRLWGRMSASALMELWVIEARGFMLVSGNILSQTKQQHVHSDKYLSGAASHERSQSHCKTWTTERTWVSWLNLFHPALIINSCCAVQLCSYPQIFIWNSSLELNVSKDPEYVRLNMGEIHPKWCRRHGKYFHLKDQSLIFIFWVVLKT